MLKDFLKDNIYPLAVACGGIIGVGFLSLPYIALKSGIWTLFFYFVVLGFAVIVLNRIFAQISLNAPDFKRFPGFAKHYLGKKWEFIAFICTIVSFFGVLLVYILVGSSFLGNIFQPIFGGDIIIYQLIYFALAGVVVFFGINVISKLEPLVLSFLFLSIICVFVAGFGKIELVNLFSFPKIDLRNFFLPYGPVLFSLWGIGLIPEVEEMIRNKKHLLGRIVSLSVVIVAVFYILFTVLVFGITGSSTTQTALLGIKNILGNWASVALIFAGFLATFSAFIMQGTVLKEVFQYDMGIKHWQAFVLACFIPLVLLLLGLDSFIGLISFLGGVVFGIFGFMILLMYKKIPAYKTASVFKKVGINFLSLIFILGVIYEIIYSIR